MMILHLCMNNHSGGIFNAGHFALRLHDTAKDSGVKGENRQGKPILNYI
jgi:hypothetical protein